MDELIIPTNEEREIALVSYKALSDMLRQKEVAEMEVTINGQSVKVPRMAIEMLEEVLKLTGEGKPVMVAPVALEMTTQAAADMLGVSRPFLVKLLEEGHLPYTKLRRHRRLKLEDVLAYKKKMLIDRRKKLDELIEESEKTGLYDTLK